MSKLFRIFCFALSAVFMVPSVVIADPADPGQPFDVSVMIPINIPIGEILTMSAISRNRSADDAEAPVQFTNPGVTPWTISDQYIDVVYSCNLALWGIRIVSDNKTAYAGMYGKPTDPGPNLIYDGSPEANPASDDACSYAGLIDNATKTNPDNRATLAWQVFANKTDPGAPYAINDDSLKGLTATGIPTDAHNWNSPWAAVVDIKNTTGGTPQANYLVDITVDPDNNVDTIPYMYIAQGGASSNGLNFHPALGADPTNPDPKPGDGQIAVFLAARFGGLSAGSYGTQIYVQLVRE